MRQFLQPQLVNDAIGDPTLFVDLHEERRALLFDIGDLSELPPRKLLLISHIFVRHTTAGALTSLADAAVQESARRTDTSGWTQVACTSSAARP